MRLKRCKKPAQLAQILMALAVNYTKETSWLLFVSPAAALRLVLSTTSLQLTSGVRRDGAFIERLGFYKPSSARGAEEGRLRLALDRVNYWKSVDCLSTSDTAERLIKSCKEGCCLI